MRRALVLLLALAGSAGAAPQRPTDDAQLLLRVEPRAAAPQDEAGRLRRAAALLAQAQAEGDARPAGRALALLPAGRPALAELRARVLQHLHRFDEAAALLGQPGQGDSAWLLLASIRRTQGRLADSDAACAPIRAPLPAQACQLENAGLRDPRNVDAGWQALLATPGLTPATEAWLRVSRADALLRAGQAAAAERELRRALALDDAPYTRIQLADLLPPAPALALLAPLPASDAVLARRALLAERLGQPDAAAWNAEMATRWQQAEQRRRAAPDEPPGHAREHALWLLPRHPTAALAAAQANAALQREPIDLLVLAQAAQADASARRQAAALVTQTGIRDERLDALLR